MAFTRKGASTAVTQQLLDGDPTITPHYVDREPGPAGAGQRSLNTRESADVFSHKPRAA